jgi:hypothetical protein
MKPFLIFCLLLIAIKGFAQMSSNNPVNVMVIFSSESDQVKIHFWGKNFKSLDEEIFTVFGKPDANTGVIWTWEGRTIPGVGENLSIYIQSGHMTNSKKSMTTKLFVSVQERDKIVKKLKGKIQPIYNFEARGDDHQSVLRSKETAEKIEQWLKSMKSE